MPTCLRDILKEEWGFPGFVESDWVLGVHSSAFAAESGLDLEMPLGIFFGRLDDDVRAGALEEAVIDDSVRRLLRAQLCFELDERARERDPAVPANRDHVALAREVARRAAVLLKNEGGTLPLRAGTRLAVTGPLADVENIGDDGSSEVIPPYVVTLLEGITARADADSVTDLTVGDLAARELDARTTVALADAEAVVVVAGFDEDDEGESVVSAGDRQTLALPDDQVGFIRDVAALNPNTIVILMGGSAISMAGWLNEVRAVMMAWYPGLEGGHAIAELLYGDASPSGRLPITFAAEDDDLPHFDNVSLEVTYDADYGYRRLGRTGTPALFPFGFGLTYGDPRYLGARIASEELAVDDTLEIVIDVANRGDRAILETVQLYTSVEDSRVTRAPRELRAFAQVDLAPGATRTVTLTVPVRDLAFYDVAAGGWEVERTAYVAHVGPDVETAAFALPFEVR